MVVWVAFTASPLSRMSTSNPSQKMATIGQRVPKAMWTLSAFGSAEPSVTHATLLADMSLHFGPPGGSKASAWGSRSFLGSLLFAHGAY